MADLNEEEVKQRAYQLWEQEGCPEGREFQNYMQPVKVDGAGHGDFPARVQDLYGTHSLHGQRGILFSR